MYEYLNGRLVSKQADHAIIDVNGIGYRVKISYSTYEQLPVPGESLKIHTYHHVREDVSDLYGFAQTLEREFFFKLIAISKIGPKAALAILSGGSPEDITNWVLSEDAKTIAKTPGVGPTTAKRIILELKPKFEKGLGVTAADNLTGSLDDVKAENEAVMALEALGYSRTEVYPTIRKMVQASDEPLSTEDIIKLVLKK